MTEIMWQPDPVIAQSTYMAQFFQYLEHYHHKRFIDYQALHEWSVAHPELFWPAIAEFCDMKFSNPPKSIIQRGETFQDTQWFTGAKLNFAENLLKRTDQHIAIISTSERDEYKTLTYTNLIHKVANLAHHLKKLGVGVDDRVAAMLPNTPEAIIAMLATTSIGAIWSSCSPDLGLESLLNRFSQIEPKILITVDGHFYNGKEYRHLKKNIALQQNLPTVSATLVVSHLEKQADLTGLQNAMHFEDCISLYNEALEFIQLPFNHPIYILYSSGTTGRPKCLVHSAGGTLIQHLKELMLHTNLQPRMNIFYNTTVSWMMWNWLVSSLAVGATIVLYEGSPFYPSPTVLFDLIDKASINIFGIGAKYIETLAKKEIVPEKKHHFSSLMSILSTGSPLLPTDYDYVYQKIKSTIRLASISGGSDIISCFALGNPMLPVYRGELQCIGLGMDVQIYNDHGEPVIDKKGELVCTSPFPSMPVFFWNDPTGEKYQHAYFDKYPNVWAHGDYAMQTIHGGIIIYGRSDTTMNPGGIRIGSAEIYQALEPLEEIVETAVVGKQWQGDEKVVLFAVLRSDITLNEELINKIKNTIRAQLSPHHIPAKIIAVHDIPRTANNKISESAIKKIVNGEKIDNLMAIANPECLKEYENLIIKFD